MSRFASATPMRGSPNGMSPKLGPTIADHNISNHLARSGTLIGSQHFYNKDGNTVYSRYTTSDWETSNKAHFNLSEKERSQAEKLRSDAFRAVKQTEQQTRNRQAANTKRLSERVTDITFWKDELLAAIRLDEGELENMKEFMRLLDRAIADTKVPLEISENCIAQRESRSGIDKVHDDVERCLAKEVETIKKCQEKMRKMMEKAQQQYKMLRAAQHACDMDAKNKHHAQGLDDRMHQMHNSTPGIGLYPGIENVDNTVTVPMTWMKFTQDNLERSRRERELSVKLRGEMDSLMRQCATDMWNQYNAVNNALTARSQETNDAKNKMQAYLQKTVAEIKDMERVICMLKKAIYDKEGPMKVAMTRLEERTRRIDVELCNDPSMQGLQKEVDEIRESVRLLKEKLREAENALVRLLKTRSTLENDITTKDRSMDIDAKACLGMRKNMPMDPKMGMSTTMPMAAY